MTRQAKDIDIETTFVEDPEGTKYFMKMEPLMNMFFDNVMEIKKKVEKLFAKENIKMIAKRAEREYPNGYCAFVLYCNRC